MNKINAFPKKNHLCGDIRINRLFTQGKAFIVYPIRVVYQTNNEPNEIPVRVLVSAPKKRFKRAVKRNRIKRLMREAYRLNQENLNLACRTKNISIDLAFNFVGNTEPDFETVLSKVITALNKITEKINS